MDWETIFIPSKPVIEIILRGSIMYLGLFIMLRVVLKREAGSVGITDLLVLVLIADAAQNALADDYRSIPEGLILVGTIIFWSYILNWLGYRYPMLQRFVHPPPLVLVKDGKLIHRNMRKEFITQDELEGQLRLQGFEDFSQVKMACMEGDGRISIVGSEEVSRGAQEKKLG